MRRLHRALLVPAIGAAAFTLTSCAREDAKRATTSESHAPPVPGGIVTLPAFADEPFAVREPKTGITLHARVHDAPHARVADGPVRFFRTAHGVEDFVAIEQGHASMTYDLSLDTKTAALRLVAGQLEIVDPAGFPRLRVRSPFVRDARGRVERASFSIEGCAVDRDPAPPFRRALPSPGARECTLRVSWNADAVTYPVVVDPTWETTDAMATSRYEHVAMMLPSGDVLVAGGLTGDPATTEHSLSSVEIYSGGTWAAGASMLEPRTLAAAATLANGDILVTGGLNQDDTGQTISGTAEIYSVTSFTWSSTGSLGTPRSGHTATAVGNGTVLIAGGYDNSGTHFSNAEIFSAGTFSAAGSINTSRFYHAAVALSGNRVLLGGGTDPFSGAVASLELYTAGVGWSAPQDLATMATRRTLMTGTLLANDHVVFIGGYNSDDGTLASAETYDVATNTFTTASASLTHARYDAVATSLADGRVLVAGGSDLTGDFSDGEIYDPATTTFVDICGGAQFRGFGHTANLLSDGNVLVAGGYDYFPSKILATADLLDFGSDAGTEDGGSCKHILPPPVDAGSDASADVDASQGDAGGGTTDAASDASTRDAGSIADASSDASDVEIFEAGGGCNASGRFAADFGWISILAASWLGRRRRRS